MGERILDLVSFPLMVGVSVASARVVLNKVPGPGEWVLTADFFVLFLLF
jgi:hypothetical protein